MDKNSFETFATRIIELEAQRSETNGLIKEAIETFADQNDVDKKTLRKGVRVYKDFIKDSAETTEFANIVNDIVFESAVDEEVEEATQEEI
jgi:hypothetical protein